MKKTTSFSVRIPLETRLYLNTLAEKTGRTVSEVAQTLLAPGGHQPAREENTEILAALADISTRLEALEDAPEGAAQQIDFSPVLARIDRQERAVSSLDAGLHAILDLLEKQTTRPTQNAPQPAANAAPDFKKFLASQPGQPGESFPAREARLKQVYFEKFGARAD